MEKLDRFWYGVPCRKIPTDNPAHHETNDCLTMCALCSGAKIEGRNYDDITENIAYRPNCAPNWCRKYYFMHFEVEKADVMLRWAASIIVHEKDLSKFWGSLGPRADMLRWMKETITVFRTHKSGVGKYVSHFGTSRMPAKAAANAMYLGQGKQISVGRHQVRGNNGETVDLFQLSFDHGNRLYADYMGRLFPMDVIQDLLGRSEDPKEEAIGDCVEICLGILRVALMYEGCQQNYFGWSDINEVLTGLEHSLLVFNAAAYPTGTKNRKMNSSNKSKNRKVFAYDDCLDVPIEIIPERICPVVPIMDEQGNRGPECECRPYCHYVRRGPSHHADRGNGFRRCLP